MPKKSKNTDTLNQKLSLTIKSGKYRLGYKLALRSMRQGQAKMIIISNNCPAVRKTELEYYAILCGSKVQYFDGNNVELGTACSRLHRVSVLSIQDGGDSDILVTAA
uniref:Ribosomal protein eL8/eL30/eS12/Gadd45 domain-containing protein n=1 Tax=Strombidinopsis acuminata TaxID=141414 RepID=A0A7S3SE71_9SPIT|mmetsp:Transcript_29355/g.39692  ORF Transcript_29355/g.39692 Transcript_29355/m.39692 type:complete len:107 (+) Transcript_29355:46-366(+)|eukprot:CAMPEP_0176345692 /NCGR_PEP_ID=MMETSP0126-20121128/5666_1 /TAXON_ID=141414 ORGANISM="Strombidinopsis acuminatum, Strain SPMC142" /NCGR_SAMPLE_ID=MMETSP0126 /ASSEMBLY_ACC=CAM_ASM_000229 /LENGTH=106 /DNA_ID=CAMNT_0017692831 /DNA_START=44 /DNA_END=364 /DNA_ORIENTATION=-